VQASAFAGIVTQVKTLICCGLTNTLWDLWLASVILGAIAGLLGLPPPPTPFTPAFCLFANPPIEVDLIDLLHLANLVDVLASGCEGLFRAFARVLRRRFLGAGVLAIIKVVSAIHPITRNQHYTPHTPNGAVVGKGKSQPA